MKKKIPEELQKEYKEGVRRFREAGLVHD